MDTLLITGATGFVGFNFIKDYSTQFKIFIIVRKSSNTSALKKILPEDQILYFNPETIESCLNTISAKYFLHLATYACFDHQKDDIKKLINSNIEYPALVLDAFIKSGGKKLLNIGSYWQHYNNELYLPNSLYAATKQAFEDLIDYYANHKGLNSISLHLFDTYGPNDKRKKIFNIVSDAFNNNKPLSLTSGEQILNLTHVNDVTNGLKIALELLESTNLKHQKYLLRNQNEVTLKDAINTYIQVKNISPQLVWGERCHTARDFFESVKCLDVLPEWKAKIPLNKGLKESF